MGKRGRDMILSGSTPLDKQTHNKEDNHDYRDPPQGILGQSPLLCFPALVSCTRKMSY